MRDRAERAAWWERALVDRASFEAACRDRVWHKQDGEITYVLGGMAIGLPGSDESLAPHLRADGFWESWVSLAIARAVQPGWGCLDLGAHAGYYTLLMADRAGPEGEVMGLEPQPLLADLARWSIERNRLRGAHVYEAAAGRAFGSESLWTYGSRTGSAALYPARGYEAEGKQTVMTVTVDHLARDLRRIDLIKVDIEGAEPDAWASMADTRARSPELIVAMEIGNNRHYDLAAFLRTIEGDGFPLAIIEGDGTPMPASLDAVIERAGELPVLWLQRA